MKEGEIMDYKSNDYKRLKGKKVKNFNRLDTVKLLIKYKKSK